MPLDGAHPGKRRFVLLCGTMLEHTVGLYVTVEGPKKLETGLSLC